MTNASSPTDHALLISLYVKAIQAITGSQRKIAYHIGMFCAHSMFNLLYSNIDCWPIVAFQRLFFFISGTIRYYR